MASASEQPVAIEPSENPEADTVPPADETADAADVWLQEQEELIAAAIGPDPARSRRQISAVLASSFVNDPDVSTMERLIAKLTPVLGDDQAARVLLTTVAQCFGENLYLSQLRVVNDDLDQDSRELHDWLQELVALHGWSIAKAVRLEGEDPLGWLTLDRYVYREVVGRQWRVRMALTLNDGSKVTINDRPDSFAVLAEAIFSSLAYIPADVLAEIMPAQQMERLSTAYNDFVGLLQPPTSEQPAQAELVSEVAPVPEAAIINESASA